VRIVLDTNVVLADYVEVSELVAPTTVPQVVPGNIDDDQVIAAAVTAPADLIVSGDRKHLLPLGSHAGIAIVDVAEALRLVSLE
jgi:predicted nucleic acid-binding protein